MRASILTVLGLPLFAIISCDRSQTQISPRMGAEAGASSSSPAQSEPEGGNANDANETLNLTQTQCPTTTSNKVTVSPRGELYMNHPSILSDARTLNADANGIAGKWSFAYALREILELPANPGTNAGQLAAEQSVVDSLIARFGPVSVNGVSASNRTATMTALTNAWGKKTVNGISFRWLGGAPFKLVAIVNRMDIVKKTSAGSVDGTTAGEGRFVYGFTGPGPMTVIFEYNLPRGNLSPIPWGQANWSNEWHKLKTFLADTDALRAGIQPDSSLTAQPTITNLAGYLGQLEKITENFANRNAQLRGVGSTQKQAAIAQIRTNEILTSPWEIREIIRGRDAIGKAELRSASVKNTPATFQVITSGSTPVNVRNHEILGSWLDSNIACSDSTKLSSCRYTTGNGMLPEIITATNGTFRLGPTAIEDGSRWFASSPSIKRRFMALQTCDGCHQSETSVRFTHTDPGTGNPSAFLVATTNIPGTKLSLGPDLQRRADNMKNLVCLAATTTATLDLAEGEGNELEFRNPEWYTFNIH